MSISTAQDKGGFSGSTTQLNIIFDNATVNGNGIVVSVCSSSAAPSSVTDDAGNTYTQRRTTNFFGSQFSSIYDCTSISNNPTTIHVNFSPARAVQAHAYEVNGTITAHAGNATSANTTSAAAGAFTTTTADTIAFAALKCSAGSATQPSGYTSDGLNVNSAGGNFANKVYTTTQSSINPTWANPSGGEACAIEAYTSTNTGSVVYNKSVTSTLTLTETQTYLGVFPRSVSESLTFTETQTYIDTFAPHVTSTLTLTETQTTQHTSNLSVSESVTFSETVGLKKSLGEPVSSTLTLVSTPLPIGITTHAVNESVTFVESFSVATVLGGTLSQGLALGNITSTTNVMKRAVTSTLTLTEAQAIAGNTFNESVASTITFSETESVVTGLVRSVSENLTFSETQTTENTIGIAVGESFHLVGTPFPNIVSSQEVDSVLSFTSHVAKAYEVSVTSTLTLVQVVPIPVQQTFWFVDNSVVQQSGIASSGSNGGTLVITFPGSTAPNNGIVLLIGNQSSSGTTISSITDTGGNTYTLLRDSSNLGTPRSRIYYCPTAASLTSITLHLGTTGNQIAARAYEVSGTISPDTGNINEENNSPQTTGAITTATSTLVFALDTTGSGAGAPAGWSDDGTAQGVRFIHNIYSSIQTGFNPAFSGSSRYAAAIESFTTANRGGMHSVLTFTSTPSETHTSNPAMFQTLNLSQPLRIPLNVVLQRSISQSLTLVQTTVVTRSKHAESILTFTQDQLAIVVKTAKGVLEFDQSVAVELVLNKTLLSLFQPFQVVSPGPNILHEPVSSVLTLTGVGSGYDAKPVSETLTFSQTVVGVASKAVKESLTLTQTIRLNKSLQVSAANTLVPRQVIKLNISRAVSAHSYFGFNGFAKGTKAYHESVTNTLTLTSLGTRERHNESLTQPLTLSQVIASSRITRLTVAETLHLLQSPALSISKAISVSDVLTFLPSHNRLLGDLVFQVPNLQSLVTEPCTLLRGPGQVVVLPSPQFGDGEGNTGQFTVRFSINGQSYSYVKNSNTTKLNYSFYLSRSKCRELQRFLQTYQAQLVDMQNWKGELWKVYITNNPFETTSVSMYTNGKPTNEERWDISLEFEGIRMN